MSELKACPFCGGEAESYQATERKPNSDGSLDAAWVVDCAECDCNMEGAYRSQEDAERLWNTRPAPERHNELREALVNCQSLFKKLRKHLHDRQCVYVDETDLAECKDLIEEGKKLTRAALAEQAAPVKEREK